MNKKGFTLVEILAVLVLIGLLLGIAIPGINKISSNMKNKSYNKKVNLIESAAILWGQDNKTRLQANSDCKIDDDKNLSCYKIKVSELLSDNYLDSDNNSGDIINPIDNKSLTNSCVYVYKENNRVYAKYVKNGDCTNSKPTNPDDPNNPNPTDPDNPHPTDPDNPNPTDPKESEDPIIKPEITVKANGKTSQFDVVITPNEKNEVSKISIKSYFLDDELNKYNDRIYTYTTFKNNYTKDGNNNTYKEVISSLNNKFTVDLYDIISACYNDSSGSFQCRNAVKIDKIFKYHIGYSIKIEVKNNKNTIKEYEYNVKSKLNIQELSLGTLSDNNISSKLYYIYNDNIVVYNANTFMYYNLSKINNSNNLNGVELLTYPNPEGKVFLDSVSSNKIKFLIMSSRSCEKCACDTTKNKNCNYYTIETGCSVRENFDFGNIYVSNKKEFKEDNEKFLKFYFDKYNSWERDNCTNCSNWNYYSLDNKNSLDTKSFYLDITKNIDSINYNHLMYLKKNVSTTTSGQNEFTLLFWNNNLSVNLIE